MVQERRRRKRSSKYDKISTYSHVLSKKRFHFTSNSKEDGGGWSKSSSIVRNTGQSLFYSKGQRSGTLDILRPIKKSEKKIRSWSVQNKCRDILSHEKWKVLDFSNVFAGRCNARLNTSLSFLLPPLSSFLYDLPAGKRLCMHISVCRSA